MENRETVMIRVNGRREKASPTPSKGGELSPLLSPSPEGRVGVGLRGAEGEVSNFQIFK
jgi:hypothetical protein